MIQVRPKDQEMTAAEKMVCYTPSAGPRKSVLTQYCTTTEKNKGPVQAAARMNLRDRPKSVRSRKQKSSICMKFKNI